jgi:signal peptidase II
MSGTMTSMQKKVAIFATIVVVGVVLDQVTKYVAADRLATTVPGHIEHTIDLTVPEAQDGETLQDFLRDEFSSNSPGEIRRIIRYGVLGPEGQPMAGQDQVEAGQTLTVRNRTITVIDGYWEWEYAQNTGAAFSFLAGGDDDWRRIFLIVVNIVAFGFLIYLLRIVRADHKLFLVALSLIGSGAIGNLIDRVRFGYVIDFILWKVGDQYRWPNFNVADICITVGAVTVMALVLFGNIEELEESSE